MIPHRWFCLLLVRVCGVSAAIVVAAAVAAPSTAHAFCGFFVAGSDAKLTNDASQVVLMRQGNRTVMTMSNDYQGPPENFAMVVPVPVVLHKDDVKTLPPEVFDRIDSLSAPRLVEYWERDPCRSREEEVMLGAQTRGGKAMSRKAEVGLLGVTVEARFVTGEYEVVVLSATESRGLETWLRQGKYHIPKGAAAALAPYVRDKSKFFVAKVDVTKVKRDAAGVVHLSPLRFAFDANELRLPVRLGLLNAAGKQDLIVYVLHPSSRFEVANYPNAFIPTNLEVTDGVRNNFPAFYAALFDAAVEKAGRKVVMTEYAWQTTSCDPCPTPPLTAADLATLGLDAIDGTAIGTVIVKPPGDSSGATKPGSAGNQPLRRLPPFMRGGGPSWVVTRLHTRYSAETLSEDLVFREAGPVTGGRAGWNGVDSDTGAQVVADGANNFQARYIIRHYWQGPVACKAPVYFQWGGPPDNPDGRPAPTAAKGLASAPRGTVSLARDVRSAVPLLGIPAQEPVRRGTRP